MALIIRFAQFIAQLNEAFDEAVKARDAAHRKYPFVPGGVRRVTRHRNQCVIATLRLPTRVPG